MNPKPSLSSLKRVFFSPIDQKRFEEMRERHVTTIHQMGMFNIR